MSREISEVKELTDKVCKEHRIVESHWHGEGPYHCKCGAEVNAVSEDALRWIFQFHSVSEGVAYAQREIERLLADERERFVVIIRRLTTYVDAYGPRDHLNGAATKKLVREARALLEEVKK